MATLKMGSTTVLTDTTLANAVQDNITRLGTVTSIEGKTGGLGVSTVVWSGDVDGSADITTTLNMDNFNWLTFIFSDNYCAITIPEDYFRLGSGATSTHGYLLQGYDADHVYARYIDSTTIDINAGSANVGLKRIIGTT